ncbi:MAG: cytochrome oxidase subunit III, partial [Acidimicrobiales bacterium]
MVDTATVVETPSAGHVPPVHSPKPGEHGWTYTGLSNEKLAMWTFLGTECLLFGGLISTYLLYKTRVPDTLPVEQQVAPADLYDIPFTSASSFILLMSSLTMVLAVAGISRGDHRQTRTWLL